MRETNHGPQFPDKSLHNPELNEPMHRVRDRIEHGIIRPLLADLGGQDGQERFQRYSDLLSRLSSDRREV